MATSSAPSPLDILGANIAEAARAEPAIARAMREENAALSVAAAVAELLESREVAVEELASKADLPLEELEHILAGQTDGTTSVVTLAAIAAALGYRFGFSFVPREISADQAASYLSDMHRSVSEANPGLQVPDYREVQ